MATTGRAKSKREINIQYDSGKTQIRKQLKIGFFGPNHTFYQTVPINI